MRPLCMRSAPRTLTVLGSVLLASLWGAGCPEQGHGDDDAPDIGLRDDGGTGQDAAAPFDSSGIPDSGTGIDGGGGQDAGIPRDAAQALDAGTTVDGSWYRPPASTTWQWQLSGSLHSSYVVDLYDIDLFDTTPTVIGTLHGQGRRVICYFSAGSSENWRLDFARFAAADLGRDLDGWDGERWLDVRSSNVRNIMADRLDLAVNKGCDGVEPDNVDGFANNTGFALTAQHQLDYNRWLFDEAHARGLAVGLKNDVDQVSQLLDHVDFALNEECFAYNECDTLAPFVAAGKPVFNAEYADSAGGANTLGASLCARARDLSFHTLILPWDLDDSFRVSCEP